MNNDIFIPQLSKVFNADHQCEFELFDQDDTDCEGESNLVFGYCVKDTQGVEHHYVAIEQGTDDYYDDPLTIYPPCPIVGSTVFISFKESIIECWSIDQFCFASSSFCSLIHRLQ